MFLLNPLNFSKKANLVFHTCNQSIWQVLLHPPFSISQRRFRPVLSSDFHCQPSRELAESPHPQMTEPVQRFRPHECFFFQYPKCWLCFSFLSCNFGPCLLRSLHKFGLQFLSFNGCPAQWQGPALEAEHPEAALIKWPSLKDSQGLRPHIPQGKPPLLSHLFFQGLKCFKGEIFFSKDPVENVILSFSHSTPFGKCPNQTFLFVRIIPK